MSYLYTVGYRTFGSNSQELLDSLHRLKVNVLLDVRSVPFSRKYSMFNKDTLGANAAKLGIQYIHVPELGAKAMPNWDVYSPAQDVWNSAGILPWESSCAFPIPGYNRPERTPLNASDLIVDFDKLFKYREYVETMAHFEAHFAKGDTICLMCAEADPVECHRYFMHGRFLEEVFGPTLNIRHLGKDADGDLAYALQETVDDTLIRVIASKFKEFNPNDFSNKAEMLKACHRLNNLLHGWKK